MFAIAPLPARDKVVNKVLELGKVDNRTMVHADFLANRIGGRPVGSHNLEDAEKWVAEQFRSWGLEVMMQEVGEIGVGFSRGPWFGRMLGGSGMTLHFVTPSYTAGTRGIQRGRVLREPQSREEFDRMKGAMKGAWILINGESGSALDWSAKGDSARMEKAARRDSIVKVNADIRAWNRQHPAEKKKLKEVPTIPGLFCHEMASAGVLGFIQSADLPLCAQYDKRCFSFTMETLPTVCEIKLDYRQFEEIARMVDDRSYFMLEFDIRNHFFKGPVKYHNVIGIIRGKKHPDEYVLLGAHLDAYDAATGAVDDANGVSVTMEAARLLAASGARPDRTMMFCIWTGEEFGLLGSKYFVQNSTVPLDKISLYINRDGGPLAACTVSVPESIYPDYQKICEPLLNYDKDIPFTLKKREGPVSKKSSGGSDHAYFVKNGVPAFLFPATDIKGYNFLYSEIWHTESDTYDKLYPDYLEHASVVNAVVSYGVANLPHLLSREGVYSED